MTFVDQFGGKSAGELIRAELWNKLMTALDDLSDERRHAASTPWTPRSRRSPREVTTLTTDVDRAPDRRRRDQDRAHRLLQGLALDDARDLRDRRGGDDRRAAHAISRASRSPSRPTSAPGSTSSRCGATCARPRLRLGDRRQLRRRARDLGAHEQRRARRRRSCAPRSAPSCRSRRTLDVAATMTSTLASKTISQVDPPGADPDRREERRRVHGARDRVRPADGDQHALVPRHVLRQERARRDRQGRTARRQPGLARLRVDRRRRRPGGRRSDDARSGARRRLDPRRLPRLDRAVAPVPLLRPGPAAAGDRRHPRRSCSRTSRPTTSTRSTGSRTR